MAFFCLICTEFIFLTKLPCKSAISVIDKKRPVGRSLGRAVGRSVGRSPIQNFYLFPIRARFACNEVCVGARCLYCSSEQRALRPLISSEAARVKFDFFLCDVKSIINRDPPPLIWFLLIDPTMKMFLHLVCKSLELRIRDPCRTGFALGAEPYPHTWTAKLAPHITNQWPGVSTVVVLLAVVLAVMLL